MKRDKKLGPGQCVDDFQLLLAGVTGASCGRKVAVTGRSMENIMRVATELGYMNLPKKVESASRASTPSRPSSPKRPRSITSPSIGVESILKSPVWTMTPMPVWMAKATESAIEWLT